MYLDLSADHGAADDHAENLAGAFTDLQELGVTIEALNIELAAVSVAAVDLDAVVADLAGPAGGEQLQLCRLDGVSQIMRSVARILAAISANLKPTA